MDGDILSEEAKNPQKLENTTPETLIKLGYAGILQILFHITRVASSLGVCVLGLVNKLRSGQL